MLQHLPVNVAILDVLWYLYVLISGMYIIYTLPETNIAPENRSSQMETSIPTIHFQGPC